MQSKLYRYRWLGVVLPLFLAVWMVIMDSGISIAEKERRTSFSLLANGQFVYGPNVGQFSVKDFLEKKNSPLREYASVIEDKAAYYSINPRVLLTVIEMRSGLVTGGGAKQVEFPLGSRRLQGFNTQLEDFSATLTQSFYQRLYGGTRASVSGIVLRDGTEVSIPSNTNAATFALLKALAPWMSVEEWNSAMRLGSQYNFLQVYRRLFPESDPLDDSNNIVPPSAPPSNLLKFPFASGDTWVFSGGPHTASGDDCSSKPWSSVDFAPGVAQCSIPTNRWVVSPANGTVNRVSCGGCLVRIKHEGGWETYFYHMANVSVAEGQQVSQDQHIGNPSQRPHCSGTCGSCGGDATGVHVHDSLMYNGAFVPIEGTSLEGWIVHNGSTCYQGYLQKDNQKIDTGGRVTSYRDWIPPTTSISFSGTSGEDDWYRSNVDVTLSAQDNEGGTGVQQIQYRLDGGTWQAVNASSASFTIADEGVHLLEYHAQDKAGNWGSTQARNISIDTTPPEGDFLINHGNVTAPSSTVALSFNATDALSGVWEVRVRNQGEVWGEWQSYAFSPVFWLLSSAPLNGETYTLEAQFRDKAGNLSTISAHSIILDIYPWPLTSAHYALQKSTWGAAAQRSESTQYYLNGTLGQPSPVGSLSSAHYQLISGFWSPLIASAVANDAFEQAMALNVPDGVIQSTLQATSATSDPTPCGTEASHTLWYRIVPTESSLIGIDTLLSDYDTILGVYVEDASDSLKTVACNDDAGGLQSHLSFAATVDTTYYIMVGAKGDGGEVHLHVSSFPDVTGDEWAWPYIESLRTEGVVKGYGDGTYKPTREVTRAEMAKFLLVAKHGQGYEPPKFDTYSFPDIADSWAADWIEELHQEGITNGYADGTYQPERQVTRAEMAKFILITKHGEGYEPPKFDTYSFPDIADSWAANWIEELYQEGIVSGYADGTYRPNNDVTRAQMAKFIVNAFELQMPNLDQ